MTRAELEVPVGKNASATPAAALFRGPHSLRFASEQLWFWLTLLLAPLTFGVVATVLHSPFQLSEIGLIIAIAMIYVTLARGRLLGTSVRVHETQFPEIFAIVNRCCATLGMRVPQVFVRQEFLVPITGMGLGEPYAIVISSEWLPHLGEDELEFLIGAELAHIAAGHTRITSLFSASGRENPLIALVFGAWLRRTEYTADRVGLLCCRSMAGAVGAIYATTFRELKHKVDLAAFTDQRRAIDADPSLAMGEWLGETPYAVNRLSDLERFSHSEDYAYWVAELERRAAEPWQPPSRATAPARASFYLRSLAFLADAIMVSAIALSGKLIIGLTNRANDVQGAINELSADPDTAAIGHWLTAHIPQGLSVSVGSHVASVGGIMLYSAVLVGLFGRTCGMMVFDLRVVRTNGKPAGWLRSVWRYFLGFITLTSGVFWLVGATTGWWLHDRLSGTRLERSAAPS